MFQGTVVKIVDPFYHVQYDDGDREDFSDPELQKAIALFQQHCQSKQTPKSKSKNATKVTRKTKNTSTSTEEIPPVLAPTSMETTTSISTRRLASRRVVSYKEPDEDDLDIDMEMNDELNGDDTHAPDQVTSTKRKRVPISSRSKRPKRIISSNSEEGSEASFMDNDDDNNDDDDIDNDVVVDDDDDEDSPVRNRKSQTKRGRAATATRTVSKKTNAVAKKSKKATETGSTMITSTALQKELRDKMDKERKGYKPQNNPQKLPAQPYVDPVGVDPTHGIIEGIISTQVAKVGRLLAQLGSCPDVIDLPIRLQTACSGTDAPSIALSLIQESLDKLAPNHNFDYEHVMSCEIEPFKQAYLGRNFPGVPLFPDITKLTGSEHVVDVYGRPQIIPQGNVFVAGTSCKDFSMLKTRDRQDIEDKGTSGETFLAAVEFLDKFKPPIAIFENVDGAPWAKMQEYITGRIQLAERNNTKAIKDAKKKAGP